MPMQKKDMKPEFRCYIHGRSIKDDENSALIDSRGKIIKKPMAGTVLVELDNPPEGIPKRFDVPVECVYWSKPN